MNIYFSLDFGNFYDRTKDAGFIEKSVDIEKVHEDDEDKMPKLYTMKN